VKISGWMGAIERCGACCNEADSTAGRQQTAALPDLFQPVRDV